MLHFGDINIWSCWSKFRMQPFLEWQRTVLCEHSNAQAAGHFRPAILLDCDTAWLVMWHFIQIFSVDQPSSFVSDIEATELKYGFRTNIQTTEWYWYTTSCNMYFWVLVTFSVSALTFRTPQSTMSCQWDTMKTTWTGDTCNHSESPPHIKLCIHVPGCDDLLRINHKAQCFHI